MSDNWWMDAQQNRNIRELQDEVQAAYSYAANRSRALQSKLSAVQGTLEKRLDRMAKSFDAFVELSDLRLEMAVFHDETVIRHRARQLLAGLAARADSPPPLDIDDVPGYWLKPAIEALAALVRGENADTYVAEALLRDEERTSRFLAFTRRDVHWLEKIFPALGPETTHGQRILWTACADGTFGAAGHTLLERHLDDFVTGLSADAATAEAERWRQAASGNVTLPTLPKVLQSEKTITAPFLDGKRLAVLRKRLEAELVTDDVPEAYDFAALLAEMVDEGSRDEIPLLERARELRAVIEDGGRKEVTPWESPAGSTLTLLRNDAFQQTNPRLRALALYTGRAWLVSAAQSIAEGAARRHASQISVRAGGYTVAITPEGPVSLDRTEGDIDQLYAVKPTRERVGLGLAVAGALLLVVAILAGQAFLGVVGALLLVVGGGLWFVGWRKRKEALEVAAHTKKTLRTEAEDAAAAFRQVNNGHDVRVKGVNADRDAILTLLH